MIPSSSIDLQLYSGITDDTRSLKEGVIFSVTDQGLPFMEEALKSRCSAILIAAEKLKDINIKEKLETSPVPVYYAEDFFLEQGRIASGIHGNPSQKMYVAGITGTNGKTSTAWMLYHIWKANHIPCGMIGTLGARWAKGKEEVEWKTGYTTPRCGELHSLLHHMYDDGVQRVIMEVSSEAVCLGRIAGVTFASAGFLNLTQDHLDAHKTMENYYQCKFAFLKKAALNKARVCIYLCDDYTNRAFRELSEYTIPETFSSPFVTSLPFPSLIYQINASMAVMLSDSHDQKRESYIKALQDIPQVPGRFVQIAGHREGIYGIVDYAHTPDALLNLLTSVRQNGAKTIITVFGCGGDRDPAKRPIMGKIAASLSDYTIVTDDNPRSEDPALIRKAILSGLTNDMPFVSIKKGEFNASVSGVIPGIVEIAGRKDAIFYAVSITEKQEHPCAVVLAGKGHEEFQIFAGHKEIFSDTEVLQAAFQKVSS